MTAVESTSQSFELLDIDYAPVYGLSSKPFQTVNLFLRMTVQPLAAIGSIWVSFDEAKPFDPYKTGLMSTAD
jgi:hypothetical protein